MPLMSVVYRLLPLVAPLPLIAGPPSAAEYEGVHLKAAYAVAKIPTNEAGDITAFYREFKSLELPPNTYSAIPFNGGYVGLAGPNRPHINFSIWDTKDKNNVAIGQAELTEASTRGRPDNHRFGHEGSGYHSELDYKWRPGVRYKVFVSVTHQDQVGTYSAWFGEADSDDWELVARIKRPGIHYLGRPGGFLEHPGKKNGHLTRSTAFGNGWYRRAANSAWQPVTQITFSYKDQNESKGWIMQNEKNMVGIQIGGGIGSAYPNDTTFDFDRSGESPPTFPE
jgi:hypothetical protein